MGRNLHICFLALIAVAAAGCSPQIVVPIDQNTNIQVTSQDPSVPNQPASQVQEARGLALSTRISSGGGVSTGTGIKAISGIADAVAGQVQTGTGISAITGAQTSTGY